MRPSTTILAWSLALAALGGGTALLQAGTPPPSQAAETTTHTFRQAEKTVRGSVTVRRDGDRTLLVFSDDFRTSESAPDLKVAVSPSSTPLVGSKPPAYPLQEGSYTVIAPLRSASGAQTYVLPDSIDLNRQGSVLIWCEQFNATMAWAPLHG
ncbi:DM13 domain-containing protein [Cyanobium sp. ATX 6A2]|uniref:DM13 domain-containing protein n=1 Tax=Cyanobium sp. ATX 6A2 TaxID=2823700 RepID=UPI0020CE623E|nr:DM13 domain-containing protein [Cyanobium sp. ATX 6A2]MCP9886464.1 DM13 domain-containing protein [Cyanobium sp. ATX 6A2]